MDSKRLNLRVSTERPMVVYIEDKKINAKMIDLSEYGTKVIIKSSCLDADFIKLEFTLNSSNQLITMMGTIVHRCNVRGECLMGVEFTEDNNKFKKTIASFVQQRKR